MAYEDLDAKLEEARRVLKRISGVHSVGWGYKEIAGSLTQRLAFRVYVRQKKPLAALSKSDLIPAELFGIPTDVLLVIGGEKFTCIDTDAHRPLVGGITISPMKLWIANGGSGEVDFGTLGFFGTINNATSHDRYVLLTCNHVLNFQGTVVGDKVYQPQFVTRSGVTGVDPNDPGAIGEIHHMGRNGNGPFTYSAADGGGGGSYFVDCASAKINTCYSSWCKTNCSTRLENTILGLAINSSNAIEGIQRVRKQDLPQGGAYPVTKVGRATGRTVGNVADVDVQGEDNTTHAKEDNIIVIHNTGPNCEGGAIFADHGDSGAVVVNSDRKIIGLLYGGDMAIGTGKACHIHPVLDLLGITMVSTQNPIAYDGRTTALESQIFFESAGPDLARATALRDEILRSHRGREFRTVVEKHREEVVYLVNHVRPVTVAWHRVHGPDFLAHILHASRYATYSVPREFQGVARDVALARLAEVLKQHGSPALRSGIEAYGDEIAILLAEADDIEMLAERMRAPERVA
jgi:hypothetical protein